MRRASFPIAVLAVVGALAGCGGSTQKPRPAGDERIDSAFIVKVEKVCRMGKTGFDALGEFPYADFDPLHPDAKTLPKVGAFFKPAIAVRRDIVTALEALGEPATGKAHWASLRATAIAAEHNGIKQARVALASDATAFVATVHTAQRLNHQLVDVDGPAAGFGSSSPCAEGL
jgi:hypothetical protein